MSAPDAEALVISWINDHPDLPEAFGEVPRDRPDQFVSVERTGGPRDLHRDVPTLAVQAWAKSAGEASALANLISAAAQHGQSALKYHPRVARLDIPNMYRFPGEGSEPRYQLVMELVVA